MGQQSGVPTPANSAIARKVKLALIAGRRAVGAATLTLPSASCVLLLAGLAGALAQIEQAEEEGGMFQGLTDAQLRDLLVVASSRSAEARRAMPSQAAI